MPPRVALRALVLLLSLVALPLSVAHATHSPTAAEVIAEATSLQMTCQQFASEVQCTGGIYYFNDPIAYIRPPSGALHDVVTQANAHSNGEHDFQDQDRDWMTRIHAVGCSDSEGETTSIRTFMDQVATALEQSSGPGPFLFGPRVVGECTMTGELFRPSPTAFWRYEISSLTTGAFPTPVPTPRPTPVPTPRPTPVATQHSAPSPTPVPTPKATPTATPTPTPSPTPSSTATPSTSPSPEGTVGGIVFPPEPTSSPPAAAAAAGGEWVASVPDPKDVSTDPVAIASSALLALLLLLFMGFVGELFNNTAKANYDVLVGWWSASWLGRHLRWFTDFWKRP